MNRQIVIAEIPDGRVEARHFREVEAPVPEPGPGEVLCRTLFASVDPVNRMSMAARTYRGGLGVGDVMAAFTLSELPDGTIVSCQSGWQEWAALPRRRPAARRRPPAHERARPRRLLRDAVGLRWRAATRPARVA